MLVLLSYPHSSVWQNGRTLAAWGTPAMLTGCVRMSKRPKRQSQAAGCVWSVYAKQAKLPGARHGGIYGVWECQADRLYETVAWETSQDPSGSRVVVQARTWGVGARVCGGRGRLRHYGSHMVPPHASSLGSWLEPACSRWVKAKGGATLPKMPRDTRRECTGGLDLACFSSHSSAPLLANASTWPLLSVHGPSDALLQNPLMAQVMLSPGPVPLSALPQVATSCSPKAQP